MTTLTAGDFTVIASIVGVPFGLIMLMIKDAHRRIDGVEKRIQEVERDKAGKLDWLRESKSTRSKVDQVSYQLAGIAAKLEATFGMAAAMEHVADAIVKMAEKKT